MSRAVNGEQIYETSYLVSYTRFCRESCHSRGDGREMFSKVKAPTLVIHSQEDMAIPADEGRLLASIIPGAQLVLLTSYSHYFPTDSDSADRVVQAIVRFCFSSMLLSR